MAQQQEKKSEVVRHEEAVLAFWNEHNTFEKSVAKEAPNGEYIFYDGPPFATGTPHHGHLVQSALKDAVPRYWTMRGYRVKRQWGWDCHGLPIENIVEKELGTKSKKDIIELGVKKFNDLCREKIFTYVDAWKEFIPRFGRWADLEHPYVTMDTDYMESEWWAFKSLYEKGLVYEDYRSMHICPRCETTLAQAEVTEGYTDVKDLSAYAQFELVDEPGTFFVAWTTTPWTLPGNAALAVGADIVYVRITLQGEQEGSYILAKAQCKEVLGDRDYTIEEELKGSALVGKAYTPLFDYYATQTELEHHARGWRVYAADFVTTDEGTGIVHIAPAYGQDDLELGKQEQLPFIQHVGMDGRFAPAVTDFAGMRVKTKDDPMAADIEVVKYLAHNGMLFDKKKIEHSYPLCWRCDTPLINYATSSWFVAVQKIKQELLAQAQSINWSPEHLKDGRWGRWLEGARDWSISRQRFWANTIPVWRCEECEQDQVFGSIAELQEASGVRVNDLHKDVLDEITVPCACGGAAHRVPDVLDTWFNSGSVPYASYHYPFENKDEVAKRIPADFIAEGQDQVSKWFYYQHVLSTALFGRNAFKNVITSGVVLAEDGKKMSKSLQNYPDPRELFDHYGADAVRLYLLSTPIVRAENLNFSEDGVAQLSSKVMGRATNVYTLYAQSAASVAHTAHPDSAHVLDRWIIARLRELHTSVTASMERYELDRATRPLIDFVDDLSTWYVRRSRDRFKSDDTEDAAQALATTRWVLREYAKVCAPFTPFIAEWLWQELKDADDPESVHLANWSDVVAADAVVIETMETARRIVSDALEARVQSGIKVRQPLAQLASRTALPDEYAALVCEEVNVKQFVHDESLVEPVALDTELTDELREEGALRELIRALQDARKKAGLEAGQKALATVAGDAQTKTLLETYQSDIFAQTTLGIEYTPAEQFSVTIDA